MAEADAQAQPSPEPQAEPQAEPQVEPEAEQQTLGPVREDRRIEALDVARGMALLGIFMVNIQFMTQPFMWIFSGASLSEGPLGRGTYYVTRVFFESKSYPLFSMLFGMGMVLMRDRAVAAGRRFFAPYLRRISMLAAMGAAHALFVWYGDVLFIYAMVALVVMWFAGLRPAVMLTIAFSLIAVTTLWVIGLTMLQSAFGGAGAVEFSGTKVETFGEFVDALTAGEVQAGPMDPAWGAGEADAFGNGPFSAAVAMRAINWFSMLVFWSILNAAMLHIAGMFLIGAAIMRAGIVTAKDPAWARRFIMIGALVGLPGAVALVAVQSASGMGTVWFGLAGAGVFVIGPCMSVGYFGLAMVLARRFGQSLPVRAVAAAGRMALTNYLLQSLLVAAIAQHWGFGIFGDVTHAQMLAIVLSIYCAQLIWSPLWLGAFKMGPLEWLWRCWTYLRPAPFLRRSTVPDR